MNRYLTLEECAEELRVQRRTVLSLIKKKRLVAIEITPGHFRVLDPSQRLREYLLDSPIERFPFLAQREVAEVLGIKFESLRHDIRIGRAAPVRIDGGPPAKVFTPHQVRQLAAAREKLRYRGKYKYSKAIAKWLKSYLDKDAGTTAEAIQEMLDQAMRVPEPKRSEIVVKLWALIEEMNRLLRDTHG